MYQLIYIVILVDYENSLTSLCHTHPHNSDSIVVTNYKRSRIQLMVLYEGMQACHETTDILCMMQLVLAVL